MVMPAVCHGQETTFWLIAFTIRKKQLAVIVFTLDPKLCAPAFRQVCQYMELFICYIHCTTLFGKLL